MGFDAAIPGATTFKDIVGGSGEAGMFLAAVTLCLIIVVRYGALPLTKAIGAVVALYAQGNASQHATAIELTKGATELRKGIESHAPVVEAQTELMSMFKDVLADLRAHSKAQSDHIAELKGLIE